MTEPEGRRWKRWEYPLKKWVREETFWREMTTRTLSALLAAGVIALAAIVSGYGSHEQRMNILRGGLTLIAVLVGGLTIFLGFISAYEKYMPRRTYIARNPDCAVVNPGNGFLKQKYKLASASLEGRQLWARYGDKVISTYEEYLQKNPDSGQVFIYYHNFSS